MKPLKSAAGIAGWLLRIALVLTIFILSYKTFLNFNLKSILFYISALYLFFGFLLLLGGIIGKQGFTVISGLVLVILFLYKMISGYNGVVDADLLSHLMMFSTAFYFLCNGNK